MKVILGCTWKLLLPASFLHVVKDTWTHKSIMMQNNDTKMAACRNINNLTLEDVLKVREFYWLNRAVTRADFHISRDSVKFMNFIFNLKEIKNLHKAINLSVKAISKRNSKKNQIDDNRHIYYVLLASLLKILKSTIWTLFSLPFLAV